MPNCKNKVAAYLSDAEIKLIEDYRFNHKKENGFDISRNSIIKMLINKLPEINKFKEAVK
ncbi:hypothetical protein [Kluyvera sichuanensis]|uniref:hypothetical protein n=1 Tax=Kluyvera sichuanensis TaxID=2725494 RepID=UPI002FD521C1